MAERVGQRAGAKIATRKPLDLSAKTNEKRIPEELSCAGRRMDQKTAPRDAGAPGKQGGRSLSRDWRSAPAPLSPT